MKLNLNADLGESFGPWPMGDDASLLKIVDSANIACGFHAGDPVVMKKTLIKAQKYNVSAGAHPGFADLQGFGRRQISMQDSEIDALILYQLSALCGMSKSVGYEMTHVKPHGALNNMACEDRYLANIIVQAVKQFDPSLIFLAPVLSELEYAARDAKLLVAGEIFADRAYNNDGTLVSRSIKGAVLNNSNDCIEHVKRMIAAEGIVSAEGHILPTEFQSICVHGDNAHSVDTARRIKEALLLEGHTFASLPELFST